MSPVLASSGHGFWSSSGAILLVAVVCALIVGIAVVVALSRKSGRGNVRSRIAHFTDAADTTDPDAQAPPTPGDEHMFARTERSLQGERWWSEFKEQVEIARIDRPAIEIATLTVACSVGGAVLLAAITGLPPVGIVALVAGPLIARSIVVRKLAHQRSLFSDQLPSHLQELAAAMRVGHSMISGIGVMAEGAAEPTRGEFQRVIADEQLGMPLAEALRQVSVRMNAGDMEQVSLVAELHAQTGGNMAEVIDRVAESVRDRAELNRELRTLTAQARGSRWIVTAIPPSLLAIIEVVNPNYLNVLFKTSTGNILLVVAGGLMLAGSLVMGRIVKIEV
jgi:tight adherence protein B